MIYVVKAHFSIPGDPKVLQHVVVMNHCDNILLAISNYLSAWAGNRWHILSLEAIRADGADDMPSTEGE